MTIVSSRAAATLFASLLLAGSAFAQTPAPAPAAPAPAAKTTAAKPERTAASLECSKEADAKGLHGKERHKFRSKCKADAKKN